MVSRQLVIFINVFTVSHATTLSAPRDWKPEFQVMSSLWRKDNPLGSYWLLEDPLHELTFAVRQQHIPELGELLEQVSNPRSSKYGHYLSFEELGAMIENPSATNAVLSWLAAEPGIETYKSSPHGEYVSAKAKTSVWNRLLSTQFHKYVQTPPSPEAGDPWVLVRAPSYTVPQHLRVHVTHVLHATHLPSHMGRAVPVRSSALVPDLNYTTPAVLNRIYNIQNNSCGEKGSQGVYETDNQNYSPDDLSKFQKKYGLPLRLIEHDIGGNNESQDCDFFPYNCGEANLDVQYITAVAQDLPTWYWSMSKQSSFSQWLVDVAGTKDAPSVLSISYGVDEALTPESFKTQFNIEAAKLGARGITLVVSSGDDGVAGVSGRKSVGLCAYNPQWPASSPYVTAVGATQGPQNGTEEVACSVTNGAFITSGGGFSKEFSTPAFQAKAVSTFLGGNSTFGPGFNAKGRGYPDVSMLGYNYPILVGGEQNVKDGTSASAPVFAAVVSIVNSQRLALGKPVVGFANPALYQLALGSLTSNAFNDITSGANNCCAGGWNGPGSYNCCPQSGFRCAPGWDPVTGLGSVNVSRLLEVWVQDVYPKGLTSVYV